ncbi:MAG: aminoglycoside phosphotransferase family protein [Rhodospirillaceae bacterium]|nr:aminoglycoside phosphotransferase family protein [Rhodospirillaceae bacterium]
MTASGPVFPTLTPEDVCRLLREAGVVLASGQVSVEPREQRWLAHLPGDRVAWFPGSEEGALRLANERATLKAIARRCTFRVPRFVHEGEGWDLREIVPGIVDPWPILARLKQDHGLAARIGDITAALLVEQHTRIKRDDLAATLPDTPEWPPPRDWVMERLPSVTDDAALTARIAALFDECAAIKVNPEDRVLVHGDLGLHNRAYDPETLLPRGVFDYDGAAWADRHIDFRYTILDIDGEPLFEAARAGYEKALGLTLDRRRVFLHNALCAAGFLAFRQGVAPETNWCGRTLAGDLEWTTNALRRLESAV